MLYKMVTQTQYSAGRQVRKLPCTVQHEWQNYTASSITQVEKGPNNNTGQLSTYELLILIF